MLACEAHEAVAIEVRAAVSTTAAFATGSAKAVQSNCVTRDTGSLATCQARTAVAFLGTCLATAIDGVIGTRCLTAWHLSLRFARFANEEVAVEVGAAIFATTTFAADSAEALQSHCLTRNTRSLAARSTRIAVAILRTGVAAAIDRVIRTWCGSTRNPASFCFARLANVEIAVKIGTAVF